MDRGAWMGYGHRYMNVRWTEIDERDIDIDTCRDMGIDTWKRDGQRYMERIWTQIHGSDMDRDTWKGHVHS